MTCYEFSKEWGWATQRTFRSLSKVSASWVWNTIVNLNSNPTFSVVADLNDKMKDVDVETFNQKLTEKKGEVESLK